MLTRLALCMALACGSVDAALAGQLEDAEAAAERGDYETAARLIRPLADQGNVKAEYDLGVLYGSGKAWQFGIDHDYIVALEWYRKAADTGYAPAADAIGVIYANGRGIPRDYAEAVRWTRMAAEAGLAEAQRHLGLAYANGNGVPRDDVQAFVWYSLAAAQGHELASHNRDMVALRLTADQRAEAERLAGEWRPKP